MAETDAKKAQREMFPNRTLYVLALIFVFAGIINSTPVSYTHLTLPTTPYV